MVKLFFQHNGEVKFFKISSRTHKRLRLYAQKINVPLQQIIDSIYKKFNDISEELIIHHLDMVLNNTEKVEAKLVLHHDDPPCSARLLDDGLCIKCNFHPDMQSTCFYFYCPLCDVPLKINKLKCPKCGQIFKSPAL